MSKTIRTLKYSLIIVIVVLFTTTGCVSAKKSRLYYKAKNSVCDLSRLGKSKYFYSGRYQRKLRKSELEISGKF